MSDQHFATHSQSLNMAPLVQIILIVIFTCLADCRLPVGLNKHVISPIKNQRIQENNISSDKNISADQVHQTAGKKTNVEANHLLVKDVKAVKDADAIVFPSDVDTMMYPDVNKIVAKDLNVMGPAKHNNDGGSTANVYNEIVPLISKVVPVVEAKEVFTNPSALDSIEDVTFKPIEDKENVPTTLIPIEEPAEATVVFDTNITLSSLNITLNDIKEDKFMSNDSSSANETLPDFSNRFGVAGNYMLVPVNNMQTYQPMQNVGIANVQGGSPVPYVANNDRGNAVVANVGANSQYATPNVASNIGTNLQYIANANSLPNDGLNLYASPVNTQSPTMNYNYNGNAAQGNIPINIPNTYMINGQLYAAVTVPNNMNVPNSLYFVNPQASPSTGYQVANNMPLYKLVSVGSQVGGQVGQTNNVNNAQYLLQ